MRPYNRSFVTLKQERSDYSSNDRKALGRCIIEAKDSFGKISVYVQDLKPQTLYKLYIIACGGSRSTGVPLGSISVDSRGKGECKLEFDANNVGGSSLAIESFNVVAIIVPSKNDIIAPLVGYTDNVVIWKNNYYDYSLQEAVLPTAEPAENVKTPEAKQMDIEAPSQHSQEAEALTYETDTLERIAGSSVREDAPSVQEGVPSVQADIPSVQADVPSVQADAPSVQADIPSIQEDVPSVQDTASTVQEATAEGETESAQGGEKAQESTYDDSREVTLEAAHLAFKDIIHKFNEEIELLENYEYDLEDADADENPINVQAESYEDADDLSRMYSNSRLVMPFDRVFQDVDWIEISIKEIVFLDEKYFHYMYLPFVLDAFRRHKHLLLGRRKDDENGVYKYMLGAPSVFAEEDSGVASNGSFKHFISCNGDGAEQGAFGYWMLYME